MSTIFRRNGRTPLKCKVTLESESFGQILAETQDVSDTGLFVKCRYLIDKIAVGDAMLATVSTDTSQAMPTKLNPSKLKVARLTSEGLALTSE